MDRKIPSAYGCMVFTISIGGRRMREPIDKCWHWREDADDYCGYCERCIEVEEMYEEEEE